jgi:hypothetical protein
LQIFELNTSWPLFIQSDFENIPKSGACYNS